MEGKNKKVINEWTKENRKKSSNLRGLSLDDLSKGKQDEIRTNQTDFYNKTMFGKSLLKAIYKVDKEVSK